MEDEDVVAEPLEVLTGRVTHGVVTPHIEATTAARLVGESPLLAMPDECSRSVGQDLRRDPVEPGDVDDRIHHRHVDRPELPVVP